MQGGPGILAADALESRGLFLPELSSELQSSIMTALPSEASARNPVDLIAGAQTSEFRHAVREILNSGEVDTLMVIYVPTTPSGIIEIGTAVLEEAEVYEGDTTIISVFMQSEQISDLMSSEKATIPTFPFPENAARALARVVRHGEWLQRDPGTIPTFDDVDPEGARLIVVDALSQMGEEGGWLESADVDAILGAFGIALPATEVAATADEAVEAARRIGGRVALKVVSASALHKSDVGGVLLDVSGDDLVREGFEQVTSAVDEFDGVLVQEMVDGGHEILIGMTEDPNFGPLLVYGLGGVYVELLKDVAFRLNPLTDVDAVEMINGIKGAALLEGYRNMPLGDLEAVRETLLRVSAMVTSIPEITEMDLNPVKVLEPGKGVRAVDARIRVKPTREGWSPELLDLPTVVG